MIVVMGLRDRFVGTLDTNNYCKIFEIASQYSNLNSFLINRNIFESNIIFSEIGFYSFVWLLARIFSHYQFLILITSIIIIGCTLVFIKRNSNNYMLSIIMFITLGLFTFCINGMRQAIAMSICLLSFEFAKNKKFIPFLLVVLLATLFHKSAIFFIIVYFLCNFKPKLSNVIIFLLIVGLFIISSKNLVYIFDNLVDQDYGSSDSVDSGGYVTVLIYLISIIFSLIFVREWKTNQNIFSLLLITIFGFVMFLMRYFTIQIYERISYYLFYFILLLLPNVVSQFKDKEKILVNIIIIAFCVFLFAYRLHGSLFENYSFFFNL